MTVTLSNQFPPGKSRVVQNWPRGEPISFTGDKVVVCKNVIFVDGKSVATIIDHGTRFTLVGDNPPIYDHMFISS